ncbi:hypothetical protein V7S43_005061 [Phytophthora oleae]|uniref:Uncharacterized protein n=1 Tax=Phytophthora oleae TaxID=2107226 RepID=A0ABD3FXJ3_9STRA
MVKSNPVLEMIVHGDPVRLILTTDLDGILVCEDANTSRRDWLMTDSEFDNARKRLRYELHWVSPEIKECDVQTPALGYSGRVNVGFFRLDNQELQMAAVAYYLGSLDADGFIGAGFTFHPGQSPLSETFQQTAEDSHSYLSHDQSKKNVPVFIISNEIEVAKSIDEGQVDSYVWSEPFVPLGDSSDVASNSQGISFPSTNAADLLPVT